MLELLVSYKGELEVNGKHFRSVVEAVKAFNDYVGEMTIRLNVTAQTPAAQQPEQVSVTAEPKPVYQIKVRKYMTQPSSPSFDFQDKWNNGVPMPMRIMVGTVLKETKGMYKMELHAELTEELPDICMKCGRALTNPVSRYFGIGPECGGHNYTNPFDTEDELKAAVKVHKEQLRKVTWTGWVIKSAIEEQTVLRYE